VLIRSAEKRVDWPA